MIYLLKYVIYGKVCLITKSDMYVGTYFINLFVVLYFFSIRVQRGPTPEKCGDIKSSFVITLS